MRDYDQMGVHFMANKNLKKLLQLCAMVAVKFDPEMKQYYERKVAEGEKQNASIEQC